MYFCEIYPTCVSSKLCEFFLFKSATSGSVWWSPWQCVFTCVTADLRHLAPRGSFTMSMKQIPSWCKSSQDLPICTFSDLHMPLSAVREEHVKRLSGLTRPSSQFLMLLVNTEQWDGNVIWILDQALVTIRHPVTLRFTKQKEKLCSWTLVHSKMCEHNETDKSHELRNT